MACLLSSLQLGKPGPCTVISAGMVTVRYVDYGSTVFWGRLNEIADDAGTPQFNVPCSFMQSLLCLPHTHVDVEQSVNLIKLKPCTMYIIQS